MKAIFTIVDQSLSEKLQNTLKHAGVPFRVFLQGRGSADNELLALLGLGDNKKIISFGITHDMLIPSIYRRLDRELNLSKAGAGIAFTINVERFSGTLQRIADQLPEDVQKRLEDLRERKRMLTAALESFHDTHDGFDLHEFQYFRNINEKVEHVREILQAQQEHQTEEENMPAQETAPFELLITIVNRGYFETVKNSARALGARGGTVLHGLGIGGEDAAKFLGINIQPEKDIVLIVVPHEDAKGVMARIAKDAGINTEGRGVCFSLPVDSAFGLAQRDDDDDEQLTI